VINRPIVLSRDKNNWVMLRELRLSRKEEGSVLGTFPWQDSAQREPPKQYDLCYPTFAGPLQARLRLGGLCETDHSRVSLMSA